MQALKWQHTFVTVVAAGQPEELLASMKTVADQYGAEGWELVCATVLPFPEDVNNLPTTVNAAARAMVLGFKRPV